MRNARAEYGVELGRKISAQLIIADAELSSALQAEMPVLCSLAKLDEARVGSACPSLKLVHHEHMVVIRLLM